jgi:hypothetical protein
MVLSSVGRTLVVDLTHDILLLTYNLCLFCVCDISPSGTEMFLSCNISINCVVVKFSFLRYGGPQLCIKGYESHPLVFKGIIYEP